MWSSLIIPAAKVVLMFGLSYAEKLKQAKNQAKPDLNELVKGADLVCVNFGMYLHLVRQYGREVADKCLNCTRKDIENKSLKFFICCTL